MDGGERAIAAVELGGTKCVCVLADMDGRMLDQHVVPTTDPEATLGAIEAILARWWTERGFRALGIGSFGPVDLDPASPRYGHILSTPKPGWQEVDVGPRLAAPFPVPLAFDTDVNAAALAEGRWGAARGLHDHAYVTVGTGVGVGLIVNGRPTRGLGHCELGHVRIARLPGDDWPGSCPFHGDCVEGLASGSAIAARLGGALPAKDDPVWDIVAYALAQLASVLVLAAGPRRIIFGGGVMAGRPELLPCIEARLRASLNDYVAIPGAGYLSPPGLGAEAGPLGPIALALGSDT